MRQFKYVPRTEWQPVRNQVVDVIHEVQDLLRDDFTFSFEFIGSSHRNMIAREVNGNRGYDFDVDIRVNDEEEAFGPEELKHMLIDALNHVACKYGYSPCEDSTRVITLKKKDNLNSRILFSSDFAIVNDYDDKKGNPHQQYVYFNKSKTEYTWRERSKEYCGLKDKENRIKAAGQWKRVREVYLNKKCRYSYEKKSRALYAETINEVFSYLGVS